MTEWTEWGDRPSGHARYKHTVLQLIPTRHGTAPQICKYADRGVESRKGNVLNTSTYHLVIHLSAQAPESGTHKKRKARPGGVSAEEAICDIGIDVGDSRVCKRVASFYTRGFFLGTWRLERWYFRDSCGAATGIGEKMEVVGRAGEMGYCWVRRL